MIDIRYSLMLLPFLAMGLVVHECAHALAAKWLGDHFPRRNGRISLNPFRHMTFWGTAAILVLPFGWAKPVMVNPYNFRRPRRDMLLTSLAGPAANVLLAALAVLAAYGTRHSYMFGAAGVVPMEIAHTCLRLVVLINTILAVINLLPIPPLDGSRIWPLIHPGLAQLFRKKLMMVWVIVLVVAFSSGWLSPMVGGVVDLANSLVPPSNVEKWHSWQSYLEQKLTDVSDETTSDAEVLLAFYVFNAAVEKESGNALAWRGRAIACERLRRWDQAAQSWQRVCELEPNSPTRADDLMHSATAWANAQPDDVFDDDFDDPENARNFHPENAEFPLESSAEKGDVDGQ